jgi:hypothetical protein
MRFYKSGPSWYADLPEYLEAGGHEGDCLMVAGADKLLDELAEDKDEINLRVVGMPVIENIAETLNWWVEKKRIVLRRKLDGLRDGWGFYDVIHSNYFTKVTEVGLCSVSTFVFGQHPLYIIIEKEIVEAAKLERGKA